MTRQRLEPSADHPITVTPSEQKVTVTLDGHPIAVSERALVLQESTYPAAYYVPQEDLVAGVFTPSETSTYCPFKGDASYVDATVDGQVVSDAGWTYLEPYDAVGGIAGHVAFYGDKVQLEVG